MALRLHLVSKQAAALGKAAMVEFGVHGGRLGRAPDNDWCLPDDHRFLSAHHARFLHREGEWLIQDTSSNGVWHNHDTQPIGRGNTRRLAHGDRLRFGDYVARVGILADDAAARVSPATENHLDFPFDIRSLLDGSGAFRRPLPVPRSASATMTDDEPELPVPPPNAPPPLPAEQRSLASLLSGPPGRDGTRAGDAWRLPSPADAPHGTTPLTAFGRGLGLDLGRLPAAEQAQLFAVAGQLLREYTLGLMAQLREERARTAEFGTAVEPIARHPNPLQALDNTEAVLRRFLVERSPRFMGPVEAVRDAFEDLTTATTLHHEATRAGLDHLLHQLAPDQLEARFNRVLGAQGQAGDTTRYWPLYPELHRTVTQRRRDGLPYVFTEGYALAREAARLAAESAMGATTDVNETVNRRRDLAG